jgi:hypothetical protein
MNLWISVPSIVIPEPITSTSSKGSDDIRRRIFLAYSSTAETTAESILPRLKTNVLEAEDLAAIALRPLLTDRYSDWTPNVFLDCCSSATIGDSSHATELAKTMELTTALPYTFGGQGGTEVIQAFQFLQNIEQEMNREAILCASQKAIPSGNGFHDKEFPVAEAVAAIAISMSPLAFAKSFRVVSTASTHRIGDWQDGLGDILDEVLEHAGTAKEGIEWSIAHRFSDSFLQAAREALPHAKWLVRELYPEFNFGCADPLISLQNLFVAMPRPPIGTGVIWFVGKLNSVGVILINAHSVSLWNRYISEKPPYV